MASEKILKQKQAVIDEIKENKRLALGFLNYAFW